MPEIQNFWDRTHPLTPLVDRLEEKFIPPDGATKFVESELLRASSRLHYDYYNNGFGNNMSQAIAYIEKYHFPVASEAFKAAFEPIRNEAQHPSMSVEDKLTPHFNVIVAEIAERLRDADEANTLTPLTQEMFDMPYAEMEYEEGFGEEYDDEYHLIIDDEEEE